MILDFNKPFLDLSDSPIIVDGQPLNMAIALANHLQRQTKGDACKFFYWAKKLNKRHLLDLDPTDMGVLKALIEGLELEAIYKAQWQEVLLNAKEVKS